MSRTRFLAPWRRQAADLEKLRTRKGMEKHLAGLRGKAAVYHCVSRVVDRRKVFGPLEKERFSLFLRQYEEFCQIRVLTHCVMGNHFHILVEIPEAPGDKGRSWSDAKFLKHLRSLYFGERLEGFEARLKYLREQGRDIEAVEFRNRFFDRMWDLSAFMHDLKLRFARWFNREHGRDGTLWAEKFKSVLVESGRATRIIAAYIDLNPVRAGIVEDPKDYRWSGYGEAVAGVQRAREGLRLLVFAQKGDEFGESLGAREAAGSWREIAAEYRKGLFLDGEKRERDERKGRAGIPKERVEEVLARGGRLSEAEMVHARMKHFTDGLVIGGESFVEGVFHLAKDYFGPRRQSGARKIRHADTTLRSMRDLRKNATPSPH